jgi:hypothetical protein
MAVSHFRLEQAAATPSSHRKPDSGTLLCDHRAINAPQSITSRPDF